MDHVNPSLTTQSTPKLPKGVKLKAVYDYKPYKPVPPPESGSFPGRRVDRFPKPLPGTPEIPKKRSRPRRMKRLGSPELKAWEYGTGVQYLVRHKASGVYYGRVRFGRRIVRRSLGTDNLASAKSILPHFLINARQGVSAENLERAAVELTEDLRMLDVTTLYLRRIAEDPQLASGTIEWRHDLIKALRKTWPNWDSLKIDEVRPDVVRTWAANLAATGISATYYNSLIGIGKMILDLASELAGLDHAWKNPFAVCKRLGVKLGEYVLPEPHQFRAFLAWIDQQPGAADAAKLVRLLAFCGLRIQEAERVEWRHFDWANGELFVYGAKGRRASSNSDTRRVPLIKDAIEYFRPLSEQPHLQPADRVSGVRTMRTWLKKASQKIDFPHISHHDFRHLFATRCIESGVDIPTVSRWLGHKDGGALAMRVYGHLRRTHSLEAAKRVSF
jgi:integrase